MGSVIIFQWIVWICGASIFAVAIGLLVRAILRSSRRPPSMHSAAERLQRDAPPLPPAVEAKLRELNDLKQRDLIGDAEYERRRAEALRQR